MALKKPVRTAPAAGEFEQDGEQQVSTVEVKPQSEVAKVEPQSEVAKAKAAATATTALAQVAAGALAQAIKSENVLVKMRDAIPPVEFGTFPRLIGANGAVCNKEDASKSLGEYVDIDLLSWSETYVVSPGDDAEEAKKLVRYSRDGVIIDETGEDVNAYLKNLREVDGYEDAKKKKYIELIGFLKAAAKGGGPVGEIVQVSLSPRSLLTFNSYMANVALKQRLGQITGEGVESLRITAEGKSGNGRNWTILKVSGTPKA